MFITKMKLSRRTVLRGMGAAMASAVARSDGSGLTATAQTAASPTKRFGAVFVPLGERPGYWTPKEVGAELRVQHDPEAARIVPEFHDCDLGAVRSARRPCDHRRRLAERFDSVPHDRRERAGGRHDRSGDCEQDRAGHAVSRRSNWRRRISQAGSAAATPATAART